MKFLTVGNAIWLVVYLVLIGGSVGVLNATRAWAIRTFDTPEARSNWQQWRDKAEQQSKGTGSVSRREIKHPYPPTLLLLRDHYTTSLATLLLLGSVLFFSAMFMLRGVFSTSFSPVLEAEEERDR